MNIEQFLEQLNSLAEKMAIKKTKILYKGKLGSPKFNGTIIDFDGKLITILKEDNTTKQVGIYSELYKYDFFKTYVISDQEIMNKYYEYKEEYEESKQKLREKNIAEIEKGFDVKTSIFGHDAKDRSKLVKGYCYGTNSNTIYSEFCDTLGWNKYYIDKNFGRQKPLYAPNCDAERKRDVWFIYHVNTSKDRIDSIVDNGHVLNFVDRNGETIIEIIDEKYGKSNDAERITFIRTSDNKYMFWGVFEIIENGSTRIYKKKSDVFPY